jgi:hypothetical protein
VHPAIVAIAAMIMKRPANIMARERLSISLLWKFDRIPRSLD